jgi:hypothetical protein
MTGIDSKRQAALDKLFEVENELGLHYDERPEQEPVAFYNPQHGGFYWAKPTTISAPQAVDIVPLALYTTPPKREWVGLTDEDWEPLYDKFAKYQEYGAFVSGWDNFARAIEAKLKEKNFD